MADLDDMLLQAAGRTSASGRKGQSRGQSKYPEDFDDGFSDDDYPDKRSNRKRKPSGSQIPLKKRHQPEKGKSARRTNDEDDENDDSSSSDELNSAGSYGSDLYFGDSDKERLEKMSELDREMILEERSTKRDDQRLKKMAKALSVSDKGRRDSPPPPLQRSRMSTRNDKTATKARLDELRAKRMSKQNSDGNSSWLKDLTRGGMSTLSARDASSPTKRRAASPPSDSSNDGDGDDARVLGDSKIDDDTYEDSPSALNFEHVRDVTIRRSRLVKWCMEPFFEELIVGCFVRIGIGKTRSGIPRYRLCIVKNVDVSDPDRSYKFEHYTTHKYLNVWWDNESAPARWQMTLVSDTAPLEEEFNEWMQEVEKNGGRLPPRQDLIQKKEAIQKIGSFVYSAATVKLMLQEKKSASRRPINVAAEKDRLRKEMEIAQSRGDGTEVERIRSRLKELEDMSRQPKFGNEKAVKLAEMNRKNRAENFKNASEVKPVNTSLKVGEAGYDPFSRRWTRSRNYYASTPDGGDGRGPVAANEQNKLNAVSNPVSKDGEMATAAALVAAADAGKLVDTNAPVDQGTESNWLHNFDIPISLNNLQRLGGPDGVKNGFLERKQKIEVKYGYKVPDNDGRRHALTLTVSDYKRRRGLL